MVGGANYLAVIDSGASPYIYLYRRDGDNFIRLPDVDVVPPAPSGPAYMGDYAAALSYDGTYLAVGARYAPYLLIYKRTGDQFSKMTNPTIMPTSWVAGVAFLKN